MKSLVHQKNKFLHSFSDSKLVDNAEYTSLKTYTTSLLSQQRKVYKNLLKQQPALKHISFSSFYEQIKKNGCENDEWMAIYANCAKNVDRVILDFEGKTHEYLNNISIYLRDSKAIKSECRDRDNMLVEYELAQNELQKTQAKGDVTKTSIAQQRADTKKSAYETCNSKVCSEMQNILSNKSQLFDVHVQKVIHLQKLLYENIRAQYNDFRELQTGASTVALNSSTNSIASAFEPWQPQPNRGSLSYTAPTPSYQPPPPSYQPPPPSYQPPPPSYQTPPLNSSTSSFQQPAPSYQPTPAPSPYYQPTPTPSYQPTPAPTPSYQPTPSPMYQTPPQTPQEEQPQPPQRKSMIFQQPTPFQQAQVPTQPRPQPQPRPKSQIIPQNQPQPQTSQLSQNPFVQAQPTQPLAKPAQAPAKPRALPTQPPSSSTSQTNLVSPRASVTLNQPPPTTTPSNPPIVTPARPPSFRLSQPPPPATDSAPPAIPTPSRTPRASVTLPQPPSTTPPVESTNPPIVTPARAPRASVTLPQPPSTIPPSTNTVTPSSIPKSSSNPAIQPNPNAPITTPARAPRASVTLPQPPSTIPKSVSTPSIPPNSNAPINTPARAPRAPVTPPSTAPPPVDQQTEAVVPNPFAHRPRSSTASSFVPPPVATPAAAPVASSFSSSSSTSSEEEPAPIPNPFVFRPRAATSAAPPPRPLNTNSAASFNTTPPANPTPTETVMQQLVQLNIGEDKRLSVIKQLFNYCLQGHYANAIAAFFTDDLTINFPEPKLRSFIGGMIKHGNPLSFEPIATPRPTAYAVAITFKITPEAKHMANVEFFFQGEKLAGMFSQKGVETISTRSPTTPTYIPSTPVYKQPAPAPVYSPPPQLYTPKAIVPVTEDPKAAMWRAIVTLHIEDKLTDAAMRNYFSAPFITVFPPQDCNKFIKMCLYHGIPYRYELCKATKDGNIGVKLIMKETYFVEFYCIMNFTLDYKNKITSIHSDGAKVQFVTTLERPPMLTFAVRTTPKQMRGILRAQVHPTSECVVTFSVPPIILGAQESCQLNIYSPTSVNVLKDNRNYLNSAHYTILSPSTQPIEIVAEYSWIYKQRSLIATSPEHPSLLEPLNQEEYLESAGQIDHQDNRFQAYHKYLDQCGLRRGHSESEVVFCYRAMKHLATNFVYDASSGRRCLDDKGVSEGCRLPGTDCGGHSMLFVAIARANSIPARTLVGQNAEVNPNLDTSKAGTGLTTTELDQQIHVRAEFYASGVGWVPVEATEKTDPLHLFGLDLSHAFLAKHIDDLSIELPNRYKFKGGIQTYYATSMKGGAPIKHSFLAWSVEESPLC